MRALVTIALAAAAAGSVANFMAAHTIRDLRTGCAVTTPGAAQGAAAPFSSLGVAAVH